MTRRPRSRPADRPKVIVLGSGPNRIGQGIEFDYACVHAVLRPARRRVRDRHGQLQPRDGQHRLRHRRPALCRAAHRRGRARGRRGRAASAPARAAASSSASSPRSAARRRCGIAAELERCGVPAVGHQPCRHRPCRGPRRLRRVLAEAGLPAPKTRHGDLVRASRRRSSDRPRPSATPCWSARATSWAGAGMEIVYDDDDPLRLRRAGHRRDQPRAPGAGRPVPRRRGRDRRRRHLRRRPSSTSAA